MELESKYQAGLRKMLKANGWFFTKIIQTSTNGFPDILAVRDGETIYIEAKREGRKPEPLQLYVHKQLREHGAKVFVASRNNDNDLVKYMKKRKITQGKKYEVNGTVYSFGTAQVISGERYIGLIKDGTHMTYIKEDVLIEKFNKFGVDITK